MIPAWGDTETPRVLLGPGVQGVKVGPGMNVVGRDLRGTRLTGHDLSGAVFDGCNLFDVEIYQCDLTGASFRNVVFQGGSVIDCSLKGADLTDATINYNGILLRWDPDRCGLDLSWEQLKSTQSYKTRQLDHCVLRLPITAEALDFSGGNLSHTSFLQGDLTGCDFTNADIVATRFSLVKVSFGQLAATRDFSRGRVQIRYCLRDDFRSDFDFSGMNLAGSVVENIPDDWKFNDAWINGATLSGLTKQQLRSTASYSNGDLSRVMLGQSDLTSFEFDGINLTGARFGQCKFQRASFEGAVITGVTIAYGCEGLVVDQIRSSWNFKNRRMKTVKLPDGLARELRKERVQQDGHE